MLTFVWKYTVTAKGTFIHSAARDSPLGKHGFARVLHRAATEELSDRGPARPPPPPPPPALLLTPLLRLCEFPTCISRFFSATSAPAERPSIARAYFSSASPLRVHRFSREAGRSYLRSTCPREFSRSMHVIVAREDNSLRMHPEMPGSEQFGGITPAHH